MIDGSDGHEFVLCYLICPQDASNAFLGAIMLTDSRARPLHFAHVAPIRATVAQRILYGPTLDEHVRVDVIAASLLRSLPKQPHVVLVEDPRLLCARRINNWPTAVLARATGTEPGRLSALKYDAGSDTNDQETVGRVGKATFFL